MPSQSLTVIQKHYIKDKKREKTPKVYAGQWKGDQRGRRKKERDWLTVVSVWNARALFWMWTRARAFFIQCALTHTTIWQQLYSQSECSKLVCLYLTVFRLVKRPVTWLNSSQFQLYSLFTNISLCVNSKLFAGYFVILFKRKKNIL